MTRPVWFDKVGTRERIEHIGKGEAAPGVGVDAIISATLQFADTTTGKEIPMIALIVEINIKPGFKDQFMASMLGDARGSNNDEPGCLRFDVLQDNEDENKIHLFEVYEDDAAVDAHRNAPHFIKWREECADWFATENVRKIATPVYPVPEKWEKRPPAD